MKTLICIITMLSTLFIIPKQGFIDSVEQKEFLPEQIVKQFIEYAKVGNEEGIKSIIIDQPDSYTDFCQNLDTKKLLQDPNLSLISTKNGHTENVIFDKSERSKYDSPSSLGDKDINKSLALLEAEFIYATQSVFTKIEVLDTKIYFDEAIVAVEYIGPGESVTNKEFLLKNDDGWKIFRTVSSLTLKSTINENYAAPRPICEQKN